MKTASPISILVAALCPFIAPKTTNAGTWNDHFNEPTLATEWTGDLSYFQLKNGVLEGQSASPLSSPLHVIEMDVDSANCDVVAWINVVEPNLRVCTKGALLLRHSGNNGYVFALHEATQTIEVYRLATHEMLLKKDARIDLRTWYYVRAELRGPTMRFFINERLIGTITDDLHPSGSVGLAVQDAEVAWFDDFTVSGPNIVGNVDGIERPQLSLVAGPTNNVVLRFTASAPYTYTVQATSTPLSHDWETIASFTAKLQSFEAEVSDPITNGLRFYRVDKVHCGCR